MALTREVKSGLVAAALTLAAGLLTLSTALVGVFYDDGIYAGLATALAGGHGYAYANLPSLPAAVHYPPLYPLVLAPLFGLLPLGAAALAAKLLNILLASATAGLITWHLLSSDVFGESSPHWVSPTLVVAAAVAIPVLAMQSVLFAEPLFALLLAAAIVCADRAQPPWLTGVMVALAILTRSIGIAAAAGIVCFLLVRRTPARTLVTLLAPVLVAALVWGLWVTTKQRAIDPALALTYGSYGAVLQQTGLSALGVSAPDLLRPFEVITLGWIPVAWVYNLLATAMFGVGLYGLALLSRRSAIGFTLVFYLAILAIWPYPPDRFLWAVLPWLGVAWALGALTMWRRWHRTRLPLAALALLLAAGYLRYEIKGFAGRWWGTQARAISANFTELLPVVANLPASAVVATDDEALVWLYTRRRAVPLYLERYQGRAVIRPTAAEHRAYLERMGVTHVLLASATSPSAMELRALMTANPNWLTALYRWPDGRWLFAVQRGS